MTMGSRHHAWRHAAASVLAGAALASAGIVQADLQIHTVVDGLAAARCCREQCHHTAPARCKRDCCAIGAPQPSSSAVLSKKPAPAANPLQSAVRPAQAHSPERVLARLGAEPEPPASPIPIYLLRCVLRI